MIVKNDGEALTYFHIADDMGHPLAREYLRGLERGVRRQHPLGDRIADDAARNAQLLGGAVRVLSGRQQRQRRAVYG